MDEDAEGTTSDPARYPLPADGSFVWYPQPDKPRRRRLIGSFVGEIGWFLLGLAAIEAVVALFAFPASSALTSHGGEYFGGLEDAFSLILVGPLVMVAFRPHRAGTARLDFPGLSAGRLLRDRSGHPTYACRF